jgi:SAM-dependent methyltransferase
MSATTFLSTRYRSFLDFLRTPWSAARREEALRREMLYREQLIREEMRREIESQTDALRKELAAQEACWNLLRSHLFRPPVAEPFETYLARLEQLHPRAFPAWKECFDRAIVSYTGAPDENLSVGRHPTARAFGDFVRTHARGRVLDIGCGPQKVPSYLADYPPLLLSGIDPLPANHPFEFVRGFAEFLPWPDGAFDVVVVGTSLDHVLCLKQTFAEIKRVLRPEGRFLVWVGFIPGAQPYDPEGKSVAPIDDYHLFHFDEPWFDERVGAEFRVEAKVAQDAVSHFYCLAPRG